MYKTNGKYIGKLFQMFRKRVQNVFCYFICVKRSTVFLIFEGYKYKLYPNLKQNGPQP